MYVCDIIFQILKKKNCKKLTLQIGQGKTPKIENDYGLNIEVFRIKESIENEILNASLIIGHAGAGTCLQSLQAGKKLLVVINEDLMNNHQLELADRLFDEGYIHVAYYSDIIAILNSDFNYLQLKPFPAGNTYNYIKFINKMMGFEF